MRWAMVHSPVGVRAGRLGFAGEELGALALELAVGAGDGHASAGAELDNE
jgi:hypothetical protein